jgi:hypothetical protein
MEKYITVSDLKNDLEKALIVLLQQPEVNKSAGITLIGHSEGTKNCYRQPR